jgi:NAD(P)-dependent dehydrogenase (short-subunit alcohol dehydrogenase family)
MEGFWESAAAELAPFGIGVTLVEPGSARTRFGGGSADVGPALDAYADGPSGFMRGALSGQGPGIPVPGDPAKMAEAIIACADLPVGPGRLTLGSDS